MMMEYFNTYSNPTIPNRTLEIDTLADPVIDWPEELKVYQSFYNRRKDNWKLMKRKSVVKIHGVEKSMPRREGQFFIWREPGGPIAWWNINVSIIFSINEKLLIKIYIYIYIYIHLSLNSLLICFSQMAGFRMLLIKSTSLPSKLLQLR